MGFNMIIKDHEIRTKYHDGFLRKNPPTEIILHGTAGPNTLNWMKGNPIASNGQNYADWYKKGIGLFHYFVDRAGQVFEVIDPERWVFHSESNTYDENTIGIEFENLDLANMGHYTGGQYTAMREIFDHLFSRYKICVLASHDRYRMKYANKNPKPCPGPLFDWFEVIKYFKENKYCYNHKAGIDSFWGIKRREE